MKTQPRSLTTLLCGATAAAALSFAQPASANLITNPGFETGNFSGWTNVNGSVTGAVQGPLGPAVSPHSGSFQAAFGQIGGSLSQNVTTTPAASYVVDFWSAATRDGFFQAFWDGASIFSQNFNGGSGYTEHTFTVTASSVTTALSFNFLSGSVGSGDSIVLDDVSVNPAVATVPDGGSTFSLLLLSFTALFGLSRFRSLRLA